MKVAIRDNELFIEYASRFTDDEIQSPPYNYVLAYIPDEVKPQSICYQDFEDNLFKVDRYSARINIVKQQEYKATVNKSIRDKYTIDDELAILRQRDDKAQDYHEYSAYVENCKRLAKS